MTDPDLQWRPGASTATLRRRAGALAAARRFFADRGVLEVETPLLVRYPVSDPHLANVRCQLSLRADRPWFLHTSPEYHMKRLLAAGVPDCYQICKVFRDGEAGTRHLPEFTIAEWYRCALGYDAFVAESCDLVRAVSASVGRNLAPAQRRSYQELFEAACGFDPLTAALPTIRVRAAALLAGQWTHDLGQRLGEDRAAWLDLILTGVVEPALRTQGLVVVDRYPADQAALARLDPADMRVAQRFEIYLDGIELANGYHELADAGEQRRRFEADRARRRQLGRPDVLPDRALLAALDQGLPDCCGIALGLDRLLMASLGLTTIAATVSFATPMED